MSNPLLAMLRDQILPRHYSQDLSHLVDADCLLFKKGAYVFLAIPFSNIPPGDYGSAYAKTVIRNAVTCIPVIFEKGLFLVYYGPFASWQNEAPQFTVDKTALRPVILQAIHFIDPDTGINSNSRTHWGPVKFGFCGPLIDDIELLAESIQQGVATDATTGAG
jgi:hypothetical protein